MLVEKLLDAIEAADTEYSRLNDLCVTADDNECWDAKYVAGQVAGLELALHYLVGEHEAMRLVASRNLVPTLFEDDERWGWSD